MLWILWGHFSTELHTSFYTCRRWGGVLVGSQVRWLGCLGLRAMPRGVVGVHFHRLTIIGPWLLPKVGCMVGKATVLVQKAVCWSVWPSRWMTVGPWIQGSFILALESNRYRSTLMRPSGVHPIDLWRGRGQGGIGWRGLMGPSPLPHPLASYAHVLYHFCQNSCIEINLQVQVELGEL
jgi:hypothetical protein